MHKSVLLKESIDAVAPSLDGETSLASASDSESRRVFLDGTLGAGGHSAEVLRRFPSVRVIGLDRDAGAVKRVEEKFKIETKVESFANLDKVLEELGISSVDAILLDLGLSSDQFESSGRGFSFQKDEPLLMTMSETPTETDLTAAKVLNTFPEETLELILRGFGEEKYSRKIAAEIVRRRELKEFQTTAELVEAVLAVKPRSFRDKIHPATKTFQALRIAVNEELSSLEQGLEKGFEALGPGGRFAIISFHSLEDRIVKNFFRTLAQENKAELVNKKPIVPEDAEIGENPRSRSAKLRTIMKNV